MYPSYFKAQILHIRNSVQKELVSSNNIYNKLMNFRIQVGRMRYLGDMGRIRK